MSTKDSFRILSLDGGGLKGLFIAKVLADLERDLNLKVADHFDLIAGTSTGAIIALGIGLGVPAFEMLQFYQQKGPDIFKSPGQGLLKSRYSPEPLQKALTEVFGDKILGDSKNRLVIPAFNIQRREIKLFKTRHSPRLLRDWKLKAIDVALASAAAPTYFPSYVDDSKIEFVDGGIWANNPALVAVVEAMTMLRVDRSQIKLLSIGTTRETVPMDQIKHHGGKIAWIPNISDVFVDASSAAVHATCEHLLRDRPDDDSSRYIRIDPVVAKGEFKLDQLSEQLIALGSREAEHASRKLSRLFFGEKVCPFTPQQNQHAA